MKFLSKQFDHFSQPYSTRIDAKFTSLRQAMFIKEPQLRFHTNSFTSKKKISASYIIHLVEVDFEFFS
ncbi:hypothetical protein [Bacillus sp. JJ722]|uniref:hypothetical protein n=1 Tax=Bacillus sp. JJ722 TaxID=3122973 RepID=UPI002FFEB98C